MFKSSVARFLGMVAWLITALNAVNEGLKPLGYDFFKLNFVANDPRLSMILSYVVGVAGLLTLVWFFTAILGKGCHCCSDDKCGCCSTTECGDKSCDDKKGAVCPKCNCSPCRCNGMKK